MEKNVYFFCSKLFAINILCYCVIELQKSKISPNFIIEKNRYDIFSTKRSLKSLSVRNTKDIVPTFHKVYFILKFIFFCINEISGHRKQNKKSLHYLTTNILNIQYLWYANGLIGDIFAFHSIKDIKGHQNKTDYLTIWNLIGQFVE